MVNKRGIGPLLATVILVAIAITLGALVSNFLINKAKEFKPEKLGEESVYCESVTLGYTVDPAITASSGLIANVEGGKLIGPITLINRGSFSIHQLIITAPGYANRPPTNILVQENGVGPYVKSVIEPGTNNKYDVKIQFDPTATNKEIKIVPVIKDLEKDQLVSCPNRQLVVNYENLCKDLFENQPGFIPANPCNL